MNGREGKRYRYIRKALEMVSHGVSFYYRESPLGNELCLLILLSCPVSQESWTELTWVDHSSVGTGNRCTPNQVESFDGEINNNDIIFMCVALDMIGGQTQQGPPLSRRTLYIYTQQCPCPLVHTHKSSPFTISNSEQNRTDPTNEFGQIFVLVVTIATRQLHSVDGGSGWLGCWWMTLLVQILWRGFCFALPKLCWIFEVGWCGGYGIPA